MVKSEIIRKGYRFAIYTQFPFRMVEQFRTSNVKRVRRREPAIGVGFIALLGRDRVSLDR